MRFSCSPKKVHRRDAESAEGSSEEISWASLRPLRLCGKFLEGLFVDDLAVAGGVEVGEGGDFLVAAAVIESAGGIVEGLCGGLDVDLAGVLPAEAFFSELDEEFAE